MAILENCVQITVHHDSKELLFKCFCRVVLATSERKLFYYFIFILYKNWIESHEYIEVVDDSLSIAGVRPSGHGCCDAATVFTNGHADVDDHCLADRLKLGKC